MSWTEDTSQEGSPLARGCGALLAGGLVLLGGWVLASAFFATFFGSFVDLARYASAGYWPAHHGYVETWGTRFEGDGVTTARAEFLYEVDGEVYRGSRVGVDRVDYRSEASARDALQAFPIGHDLKVSVNPLNPTDAVLDPSQKAWGSLVFRLALACLMLAVLIAGLNALEVPAYAIVLAVLAVIGFGAFCRGVVEEPTARREGLSLAQMRERQTAVAARRNAWVKMKKGDLITTFAVIGEPDRVVTSPAGLQTWHFDLKPGLETAGKIELLPSTRGLVVDRVFPAFGKAP